MVERVCSTRDFNRHHDVALDRYAAVNANVCAGSQVLIGTDDDNTANTAIQPAGVAANQSLNNTDVLEGGQGNDVLIGKLGSDVLLGGPGRDILVGGPDPGAPNSDIQFGGPDDDVSLWAPGDGSEAFIGGPGRDALVFGVTDKTAGVPILSAPVPGFPYGIPTANVSGQGGFCTLEAAPASSGYDYLIRFFGRATGNLAVTVRVREVETGLLHIGRRRADHVRRSHATSTGVCHRLAGRSRGAEPNSWRDGEVRGPTFDASTSGARCVGAATAMARS